MPNDKKEPKDQNQHHQERLSLPVIKVIAIEDYAHPDQEQALFDYFIRRVNNFHALPIPDKYLTRVNFQKLLEYVSQIEAGTIQEIQDWKLKLVNNLNDLAYIEAVMTDESLRAADARFANYRQNLVATVENRGTNAEREFGTLNPDIEQTVRQEVRQKRQQALAVIIQAAIKNAANSRRKSTKVLTELQIIEGQKHLPNSLFNQQFREVTLPNLENQANSGNQAAAIIVYLIKNNLKHYQSYQLFGQNYNFEDFKSNCHFVVYISMKTIEYADGQIISKLDQVNFEDLQKLTDEIHRQWEQIRDEQEQTLQDRIKEQLATQERELNATEPTEEEILNIKNQVKSRFIAQHGDPEREVSQQEVDDIVKQRKDSFILVRSHATFQETIWAHTTWYDFSPKTITFKNPTPTSNYGGTRGFGWSASVDYKTGNITLSFAGLPNYFMAPPEFVNRTEDGRDVYEVTEMTPQGPEKYQIVIITGDTSSRLEFVCTDAEGQKTITLVEFGKPVNIGSTVRKPVIYLYSQKDQDFTLKLDYLGQITSEYPRRVDNLWSGRVLATSGMQISGKTYPYLFWEGSAPAGWQWDFLESFCVEKKDYEVFLEEILSKYAFNNKEKTDFITYWLPELQKNDYSLITFPTQQYSTLSKMTITPKPAQVIRVFMIFKKALKPTKTKEPKIESVKREDTTFHVVEWGGVNLG